MTRIRNARFDAVVFDMDGVLIDSEPMWRQAKTTVFDELEIEIDDAENDRSKGFPIREFVAQQYFKTPWFGKSIDTIENEIVAMTIQFFGQNAQLLPGVFDALQEISKMGLKMAIASSSPNKMIREMMQMCRINRCFQISCSGEDEIRGKPDPAVYISASRKLNVTPERCIAVEDSVPGVQSAKSAGMFTIAIPTACDLHDDEFLNADVVASCMCDLNWPNLITTGQNE